MTGGAPPSKERGAPEREVDAKNEAGIAALSEGRHADARTLFEEAVSIARSALEPGHLSLLEALYNRGTWPRDPNDAIVRAADLEEVTLGTRSLEGERARMLAASATHNLAALREEAGRDDDARDLYTESLRLRQELRGTDHPSLRPTLVRLAQLEHRTGRTLLAVTLYERALVLARAELGPDHPHARAIEGYKRQITG